MNNALFEIGTEEIPTSYIRPVIETMAVRAAELLCARSFAFDGIKTFATPRRLALIVENLAPKGQDRTEEMLGPSLKAGKDAQGNFTPAARGFAGKHGIPAEKLTVKTTDKGEYLCAVKHIPGQKAEQALAEIFPELMDRMEFPKTMVWEPSGYRFPRPIRSLVAMYGGKVIRFSRAGLKSGNKTVGLFTTDSGAVVIKSAEEYVTALQNKCVIVDPVKRRAAVKDAVMAAAESIGGREPEDEELYDEVTYLVEHPAAIVGSFDEKYLALPDEVLVTCLKKKQKYFALKDKTGRRMNKFIGVRNGISEHQEIVREGYERVLTARLSDAEFFFKKDTHTPLIDKFEKLNGVVFQQKLGTVHDKIIRVNRIASSIAAQSGRAVDVAMLEKTCRLAKADLVTDMVFEYPELQGVVGRIYAARDGEPEQVSRAIEEHYWPLSADGKLPETELGILISLADKTDTLVGDFAAGLIPSGSADPYGLRRMAIGIVRIIQEKRLKVSLKALINDAFASMPEKLCANDKTPGLVMDFFRQRLENLWEAGGFRFDEIRAVLATGFDDILDARARLEAVHGIRSQADFVTIAAAFKRAANILKQAEKMKVAVPGSVNEALLAEEAEKELYAAVHRMEGEILRLIGEKSYAAALALMVSIKPAVDAFFEKVMVMAEDQALRANRLALVGYTTGIFFKILDFAQLQGN